MGLASGAAVSAPLPAAGDSAGVDGGFVVMGRATGRFGATGAAATDDGASCASEAGSVRAESTDGRGSSVVVIEVVSGAVIGTAVVALVGSEPAADPSRRSGSVGDTMVSPSWMDAASASGTEASPTTGARTSSRTPALAAAVCSGCFGAVLRAVPERAGVRFAGVRVVVDFAAVVRFVPVFAAGLLVPEEAPVVRVVVLGARGVDAGAAGVDPSSGDSGVAVLGSVSGEALAGVRFAAVVRAVPVFAAVVRAVPVFAAVVREPVDRVVVVFFAAPVASVESAPAVVRAALGRFAGAFVVPEVRGVVVLGARFAADGAEAD